MVTTFNLSEKGGHEMYMQEDPNRWEVWVMTGGELQLSGIDSRWMNQTFNNDTSCNVFLMYTLTDQCLLTLGKKIRICQK